MSSAASLSGSAGTEVEAHVGKLGLWPTTWSSSATLPPRAERHGRAAGAPLGQGIISSR
ncbi:hypothetical protein WMF04_02135 [Sorangium sp. So ce260]|uniref:hypothetical protein n=1 Tax=Sorangium sp. So ce260 TaxID=3133291 RepID=UPI003F5E48B2